MFLWGHSAETGYLSQLLSENPGLWKGAILFDPGALPDLESMRGKELLIISGKDADNAEQLKRYQQQALASGVSLTLVLQDNCHHNPASVRTMRERTVDFAKFLAEQL